MRYFKNLTRSHKITLYLTVFFIGAAVAVLGLPFKTTLTSHGGDNTQTLLGVNMPCSRVELVPAEKTAFITTVTGKGFAFVRHTFTDDEIRLQHIGLLRHIDCTIRIELAKNAKARTPLSMPFIARDGVYPISLEERRYRTFTRN